MNENTVQQSTMMVNEFSTKTWRINGKYHREDGPAIEWANGDKEWYLHDKLHREDGPAFEGASGFKAWYLHDMWHREGGPAVEYADGTKEWYLNGKLHREDGPAFEWANGYKAWFLNDEEFKDAFEWAEALLELKGIKNPSDDEINNKVQQVTSKSILD